jgi:uncharacterized protein (DUF433 family)
MAQALITRREAAELSGTTETTVKKAVDQKVIPTQKRGSQLWIEVDDVPVLFMLGQLRDMKLGVQYKRQLRAWLRTSGASSELELMPMLIVRKVTDVEEARRRAERYAQLRDRWIVCDPNVKGGEPVIRGSRVSVHTLAERLAQGEPEEILDEDFPHIPPEAREVAVQFARANPRRGRPRASAAA